MLLALGITLNICAANEHVSLIERCIRTFKERVRAIRHGLPYKNMPGLMIVHLVYFVCHWLNAFPPKGGISDTIAPAEFIDGRRTDYHKHCKLSFGSYVQTHEENNPTNSMQSRTLGAITLGPDTTGRGGYYFMNLNTGRRIHRRTWDAIPMPDTVIKRVEHLGKKDGQPELLTFTDRYGENILDHQGEEQDE